MGWIWQRKEKREPVLEPLSDRQYKSLFLSLLQEVAPAQIQARLGERQQDRNFVSWLRRFGSELLKNPAANAELGRQMVRLGAVDIGTLGTLAKEIGEQQLLDQGTRAPERVPPVDESRPSDKPAEGNSTLSAKEDEQASFYFQQGNEAFSRGDFRGAIAAYDKALHFKPDYHEALYNKGISLYNLGRYEEAIAAYDQALLIKPDDYQTLRLKGVSFRSLSRYEEALASYDEALRIKPDFDNVLNSKGCVLIDLGRYEEALAAFDEALRIKPDWHPVLNHKGHSLNELGRYEEAIAAFDEALRIKPDFHNALSNKGYSLNELGRYEEAIAAYDQALRIKPDFHNALNNKGYSLANLGRYEEAIAAFDEALRIKPDMHEAWLGRGSAAGQSHNHTTPVAFSLSAFLQHPSLEQRGYEGKLACYTIGLNHVQESKNPEGWGRLHYSTGRAHYFHSRFHSPADIYLAQAASSYQTALTALTAFPSSHLEVLQDAIRAYLGLNQPAMAQEFREQGLEVFRQLLNAAPNLAQKQRLEKEFSGFSQIQVDSLIRDTNPTTALETAERYKNLTLGWLLDSWQEQITSPSWAEMQALLTPNTAALYWHLSPDSLTTFLLTAQATEPQVVSVIPVEAFKKWFKAWQQRYQTYRKKSKATEGEPIEQDRPNHPWRLTLAADLKKLKEILITPQLEASLSQYSHLLLIPHRELHQLPLHALFTLAPTRGLSAVEAQTITYLPSLQTGLTLKNKPCPAAQQPPALLLETPENDLYEPLVFAEVETALIAHLCQASGQSPDLVSSKAHKSTIAAKLQQPHRLFHFTGHGAHDYRQPKNSAIALTGSDSLSAAEIAQLPLHNYDLITLAACETAVTSPTDLDTDYVSLASAFLTAGATQVISTLWTVDSESNAWLMVQFYQRYLTGTPAPLALHQAQHWLRSLTHAALADWLESLNAPAFKQHCTSGEDETLLDTIGKHRVQSKNVAATHTPYADPYYWAAFTLTGQCR
jgi:CHAT domain-containing protein/Flp pilus assembly protein TadD